MSTSTVTLNIESNCKLGKAFTAKLEKQADDKPQLVTGNLKFTEAMVTREQIDWLLSQPTGWCNCLYDELGAPLLRAKIHRPKAKWLAQGELTGPDGDPQFNLVDATLSHVAVVLANKSGELSGSLSWNAVGDEVDDLQGMLGHLVTLRLTLSGSGQRDLYDDPAEPKATAKPRTRRKAKQREIH